MFHQVLEERDGLDGVGIHRAAAVFVVSDEGGQGVNVVRGAGVEVVSGKEAKTSGLVSDKTADDAQFIRVHLPGPVPKGGETRIRILKTYTDAASYFVKDGQLVFTRPLGIKRNVVLLPKGWELIECGSPGMISTDADGRVRVSFLNDRDDQLPVKIVARRLP